MNIKLQLSKLPLPVLNAVLTKHGLAVEANKTNAVTLIEDLVSRGLTTLPDVENTKPTAVTSVAGDVSVPDEIRKKLLSAQAEVANAVEGVRAVRDVADRLLNENLKQQTANEKKFDELSARLNNTLKSVQGVDYAVVESQIRSEVSKLFASFKKETPKEELTVIANALPVCERKQVKDVFDGQLRYEHHGEVIEFGDYWVDVWNDPDAPARVDDYVFDLSLIHI